VNQPKPAGEIRRVFYLHHLEKSLHLRGAPMVIYEHSAHDLGLVSGWHGTC
jgi:hypothetical protein